MNKIKHGDIELTTSTESVISDQEKRLKEIINGAEPKDESKKILLNKLRR